MIDEPTFLQKPHDERDPSPWQALYFDQSVPMADEAKRAWLACVSSRSRQFLLPLVRPFARLSIAIFQVLKLVLPRALNSSWLLHRLLEWSMRVWLTPEANLLIMRHFYLGSEILRFVADNAQGVELPTVPLKPRRLEEIRHDVFLKHDLNLYNFVIKLNQQLREQQRELVARVPLNFSAITDGPIDFEPFPRRVTNFVDLETAIEAYTPLYQLLLTDSDFWRATTSLQLDETVALYASKLLGSTWQLSLVNNKHPMAPLPTLQAGFRLVLHGLATESLHALLVREKQRAELDRRAAARQGDEP